MVRKVLDGRGKLLIFHCIETLFLGVDYFLERNMAVTFNLRMGPIIYAKGGGSDFDLQALIGLAFKL